MPPKHKCDACQQSKDTNVMLAMEREAMAMKELLCEEITPTIANNPNEWFCICWDCIQGIAQLERDIIAESQRVSYQEGQ